MVINPWTSLRCIDTRGRDAATGVHGRVRRETRQGCIRCLCYESSVNRSQFATPKEPFGEASSGRV